MTSLEKKRRAWKLSALAKVILGLGLLALGTWLIWIWRWDVAIIFRGCTGIAIILIGTICLAIAKE